MQFLVVMSLDAMLCILGNQQLDSRACYFKVVLYMKSTTVKLQFQLIMSVLSAFVFEAKYKLFSAVVRMHM